MAAFWYNILFFVFPFSDTVGEGGGDPESEHGIFVGAVFLGMVLNDASHC